MPKRDESEDDSSEESGSEEEDSEENSEDGSEEGSDEDGSDDDSEEDDSGSGSGSDDSEEDDSDNDSDKKSSKDKKKGVLNVSLEIDKESGKVLSTRVSEPEEDPQTAKKTETSTTQTDYNMFFPPLSEALYYASTSSTKKDELLEQAKKVLLAPDSMFPESSFWSTPSRYNPSQPLYQPISSPYYHNPTQRSISQVQPLNHFQPSYYPLPPSKESYQPPMSSSSFFYSRGAPPSPSHGLLYQNERKYDVGSRPKQMAHNPYEEYQNGKPSKFLNPSKYLNTNNSSPPPNNEEEYYGRYVNEKEFQKRR